MVSNTRTSISVEVPWSLDENYTYAKPPDHFRCPLLVGDGVRVCVPPSEGEPHLGLAGVDLGQLLGEELGQEGHVVGGARA